MNLITIVVIGQTLLTFAASAVVLAAVFVSGKPIPRSEPNWRIENGVWRWPHQTPGRLTRLNPHLLFS